MARAGSKGIFKLKFSDIPNGTALVGDTEKNELKELFGLIPPAGVVINRDSFVLVYKFPKPLTREMEEALVELARTMAESAEENGLEADITKGSGRELLVLRIGKVLNPLERSKSISRILHYYSRKLEEAVAEKAGFIDEGSESGREDSS